MALKIVYVGNALSYSNSNLTTVEILSQNLKDLSYQVKSYSNQSNKVFRLLSMLWGILRHRNYDYVLIDTYSTSAFWFAWSCARLCKTLNLRYILVLHGGNLPERLNNYPKLCNGIIVNAYINISPSHYLLEAFKVAGYSNLKVIPNSIEIKNYPFKQRKNIRPRLLWVRAFAKIYNPILALRVFKLLRKDYPETQLSMVGPFKDDSIEECRAYAKKYNLPVIFTGKMSKKQWITYAQDFDIFINTTNVDNTPVSVIEAIALGLPIVTTNVGGLPYLLEHQEQALLVDPNDENAMKKAILNLLRDEDLVQKLSQNGRQLAETFDWEVVKTKWQEVLQ